MNEARVSQDREILRTAQASGRLAMLGAFLRLSGPGWLQSAITLGGGSLAGALYLGVIGGYSMLWMQLIAIAAGVVMLSAISYVTLSTGIRPYAAINRFINPVLGVGWVAATILANMIFILPQFSLCFDALKSNLFPERLADDPSSKILVSAVILVAALGIVLMNLKPGLLSKLFDLLLKAIVGGVVICFVLVVYLLARNGEVEWVKVAWGMLPNYSRWNSLAPDLQVLLEQVPEAYREFWSAQIIAKQQPVMISSAATAVGINMTFLLPYSMLSRGWDRTFRGLAFWDLITGMAIPFVLVTSCIVIASGFAFHGKVDAAFLSDDPAVVRTSPLFPTLLQPMTERWQLQDGPQAVSELETLPTASEADRTAQEEALQARVAAFVASLPEAERRLSMSIVSPNTNLLAQTLTPLLGQERANLVFGLGVLGMGFSTIVILMLINGYAFAEVMGDFQQPLFRAIGAIAAGAMGFCWFLIWQGESKTYLAIVASTFAILLLPVAYLAFMLLMNHSRLMGGDRIGGIGRWGWNIAMTISLLGALAAAASQLMAKANSAEGAYVIGAVATFLFLMLIGFSAIPARQGDAGSTDG